MPEWRFRVTLPGGKTHPLVPDVVYMSFERLRTLSGKALQHPAIPPEIVVEIRSRTTNEQMSMRKSKNTSHGASLSSWSLIPCAAV